jgi:hypothetical protein
MAERGLGVFHGVVNDLQEHRVPFAFALVERVSELIMRPSFVLRTWLVSADVEAGRDGGGHQAWLR